MSDARTLALLDELLAVNRRLEATVSNLISEVRDLRKKIEEKR